VYTDFFGQIKHFIDKHSLHLIAMQDTQICQEIIITRGDLIDLLITIVLCVDDEKLLSHLLAELIERFDDGIGMRRDLYLIRRESIFDDESLAIDESNTEKLCESIFLSLIITE